MNKIEMLISKFEETVDSFKFGSKFEKLNDILNYN